MIPPRTGVNLQKTFLAEIPVLGSSFDSRFAVKSTNFQKMTQAKNREVQVPLFRGDRARLRAFDYIVYHKIVKMSNLFYLS